MPLEPDTVITYFAMCQEEGGTSLQRGMNFRLRPTHSVILMSQQERAPYTDRVEEDGTVIVFQGHNVPRPQAPDPDSADQELRTPSGRLTQNGLFFEAAGANPPELVRVYEKLLKGLWVYNGAFSLTDAWAEVLDGRRVFKFRLKVVDGASASTTSRREPTRVIPSAVKKAVWLRDGGRCVLCGADDGMHYDHDIPFSRGGGSTIENVRILCARHNLEKGARIE